jgi:hypothetical protein
MRMSSRVADETAMTWPVAALAVLLLGFVVAYGSVLQSRLGTTSRSDTRTRAESDD